MYKEKQEKKEKKTDQLKLCIYLGITGGPLKSQYLFWQFHMHWGRTDSKGSEHLIDNQSFAGEVQN
jgi:hypothetical protein